MAKTQTASKHPNLLRGLLSILLLAVAVEILVRNWDVVKRSAQVTKHVEPVWVVGAFILVVLTYYIAAAIYKTLALHKLRYGQTVVVEVSTAFVNRLLPSGVGGLGVHGLYLFRRKHTAAEATAVVSVNNLLGMAAHFLLLALVVLFSPDAFAAIKDHYHLHIHIWIIGGTVAVLLCLLAISSVRRRLESFTSNILTSVRKLGLVRIARALFLALLLTATYTAILFACTQAVGLRLNLLQIFVAFSLGMLTGTASPTPGGLVGMEAGLFAGFVGYGATDALSGAAVLLYRLLTYWLPLLPGLAALGVARRQKIL